MDTRFAASQSIDLPVVEQPIPIQRYLQHSQRLVYALSHADRIAVLSEDCYRFQVLPISFMHLSLCPIVDLRITTTAEGRVDITSIACDLQGMEAFRDCFELSLVGQMYPTFKFGRTYLEGQANLQIEIDLPMPFKRMPKLLLETTGNAILKNVLATVRQRLLKNLLKDYQLWVQAQGLDSAPRRVESDLILTRKA